MNTTDSPPESALRTLFILDIALLIATAAAILADGLTETEGGWGVANALAFLFVVLGAALALLLMRLAQREKARLGRDKQRAESTLDSIGDAVIRYDLNGRICHLNQAARQLLGVDLGEIRDIAVGDVVRLFDHRTRQSIVDALLSEAAAGDTVSLSADTRLLNEHGIELEIQGSCRAILNGKGAMRAIVLVLRDVTEEREWMRQQLDLWDRDPLTALPGRRYLENRLGKVLLNKRTVDLPMTYLQVNLAGVPEFVGREGRDAGDALIRHVVALLRSRVRETDLIARVGEHVMGVLLTNCPPDISGRIEAEIRASLATYRFEWAGCIHEMTSSMGAVLIPPFEGSVDELMDQVETVNCAPGSTPKAEPPPEGAKSFLGRPGERLEGR